MFPVLYKTDTPKEEFFTGNGLGVFTEVTRCQITEERNGLYELDMDILPTSNLAKQVAVTMFVKAKPNPHDEPQLFEIYSIDISADLINIKAQHIHYILNGNVTTGIPANASNHIGTPNQFWNLLNSAEYEIMFEHDFNFYSDITSQLSLPSFKYGAVRFSDVLGSAEGSFLDTFGGEYHYDNFNIKLLKNRGNKTGICLRYGSNISKYAQEISSDSICSDLLLYAYITITDVDIGSSEDTDEKYFIYRRNIFENTPLLYKRAGCVDFSEEFSSDRALRDVSTGGGAIYNGEDLRKKLDRLVKSYLYENKQRLSEISTSITVDVDIALDNLKDCVLCDTVLIYYEPLDLKIESKIRKTIYNPILEKYTSLELGTVKKTLTDLFKNQII